MRKMFFIILLISTLSKLNAQDVDLRKATFETEFVKFSKMDLPTEKHSYSFTEVNGTGVALNLKEELKLNGFKLSDKGDVIIKVSYPGSIAFAAPQTNSRIDPITNTPLYQSVLPASIDGRITIECESLNYKRYDLSFFKATYPTKEFRTAEEAVNEMKALQATFQKKAMEDFKTFAIEEANYYANKMFGSPLIKATVALYNIEPKSHPEYENFQKNYQQIKTTFSKYRYDSLVNENDNNLQQSIEYYKSLANTYKDDSKAHKKIRYAAYYNLMKIYFNMEKYAESEQFAQSLISNGYNGSDGKQFLKYIKETKDELLEKKQTSNHIKIYGENRYMLYRKDIY